MKQGVVHDKITSLLTLLYNLFFPTIFPIVNFRVNFDTMDFFSYYISIMKHIINIISIMTGHQHTGNGSVQTKLFDPYAQRND